MGHGMAAISDSERDVMKVLWEHGPIAVRELREHLEQSGRKWAHTTVNTLLSRLEQKGCVSCDRTGFAHLFTAAVSRDQLVKQRLTTIANDYCNGTRVPLMLALVDGQSFSETEIQQFRDLLDELESQTVESSEIEETEPKEMRDE